MSQSLADVAVFEFDVPVKATYTLNSRLHWAERKRLVEQERRMVWLRFPKQFVGMMREPNATAVIKLTRIGPREMDSDNVQGALKAIRDEIALRLGLDDGDKRYTWEYEQRIGHYCVEIAGRISK